MIKRLLSNLYWWSQRQRQRRYARKRLVELEQRLAAHDTDIAAMEHFPQATQEYLREYRERLVKQIEAAQQRVL